ncbi:helix-turn-helix transcriptional regulator [Haloplanus litoreus]|uniref:Helix-turn-helix transcriptional regulator n=1 Tax=Haloplanus litoreus TaxID=767515 RepID=A0ABD5ZUL1_9EURY
MRIAAPLLALLVLLTGTFPAVALAGTGVPSTTETGDVAPSSPADRPALVGPSRARIDDPTVTELYIAPDPDGTARWNVSIRYNLSTETDRAAFERYGRTFEAGDAGIGLDAAFFRTLAEEASRATGREMSIRNPTRNATVSNGTGVLSLSFTWTNFVTDTDHGFAVEDAVLMPGNRTWLASIEPSQRLVVETPEGYQVTDTRFGLDNGSVVIQGPHTFREPLTISYQQTAPEEPEPQGPPWSLIGGALLVGLGLVAAVIYIRRHGEASPTATDDAGDEEPEPVESSPDATPAADGTTDATDEATTDEADTDGTIDPSLLSDEERVERLLDENGGRMKQARIVRETGWSDAKVSQLLSTMADDGRIEKLRLGRENLISLPDEDPET